MENDPFVTTTRDVFEFNVLMRLRQLRKNGSRLVLDTDAETIEVLGRIESLKNKNMSVTRPISSIIFEA